ncbi:hypothetical protein ADM98_00685 [Exiguobacterium sp. BMC-KP]|nr:hypothetical protein ADM98_00685 [Exiguobacterium sp. BMC-KP]
MFIRGRMDNGPGHEAELLVWDALERRFEGRESFGFLHFPMFAEGHAYRREIDILIVDREIGVTTIEVKGISIRQIKNISGQVWSCEKDGTPFEIEPYAQAERQMDMLCKDLEEEPLLYRKLGRRAIVALPYITRHEWAERGYDKMLNVPPILFKEDLVDPGVLERMGRINVRKQPGRLADAGWGAIKRRFSVMEEPASVPSAEQVMGSKGLFSLTYFLPDRTSIDTNEGDIRAALEDGKKVYLFSSSGLPERLMRELRPFIEEHQLQHVHLDIDRTPYGFACIRNGELPDALSKLVEGCGAFNHGQYMAVHAPVRDNLKIMAGAGTGKTHVMIDRIMYLLESEGVDLKDIVMITFTNDSTDEMRRRFQGRMLTMFSLTRRKRYLELAEDVKNMQISTIHSYSKSILTHLAHEIGFGRGVKIRSYIRTKDLIIERLTDEFLSGDHSAGGIDGLFGSGLEHHQITRTIRRFWDEMEKKGLTREEIEGLDWGTVEDEDHATLHELFRHVFSRCEAELERIKRKDNAIDMGDMIRKLRWFTDNEKMDQLESRKHLFVDEFQDSDNTQIELVASLHAQLGYTVFVVGDVKQSIYRFRGADYTSFERLEDKMGAGIPEVRLTQNYRTNSSLLDRLDEMFSRWGDDGHGLLPYSRSDRLVGVRRTTRDETELSLVEAGWYEREQVMMDRIREGLGEVSSKPGEKVALLVRTNKQAKEVASLCEKNGIAVKQNLDGTFYRSHAVMHFKALLEAMMYPSEAVHLVSALETPYFLYKIPSRLLVRYEGDGKAISRYVEERIGDDFSRYLKDLRRLPFLAVIQRIIAEKGLMQNLQPYYERITQDPEVAASRARQYELDLAHLMNIIHQQFGPDTGTLYTIHRWLKLQVRVNTNENTPMDTTSDGQLEITTIHRAKGLEYHTVILPRLDFPFTNQRNVFLIEEEQDETGGMRRVGWDLSADRGRVTGEKEGKNGYYDDLETSELDEIVKEETRLLYVALTRAKNKIVLIRSGVKPDTWGELLEKAMGGMHDVR